MRAFAVNLTDVLCRSTIVFSSSSQIQKLSIEKVQTTVVNCNSAWKVVNTDVHLKVN